ncbi:hypothetical protein ABEB36_007717 [Hypothenemus hampei]|uniref:Uncharacterized protein n=1 Tax=Hypothenemus hampei TaxID=57062 RepID=A0ABD1EYU3_HYPHA
MDQNNTFERIEWTFPKVLGVAKGLKPPGWIVMANKFRISFMEMSLGQLGPAIVEKQLILNHNLETEAFIRGDKIEDKLFPIKIHELQSCEELYRSLKLFSSYGVCQGNKNFKRIDKNGKVSDTDYWKGTNCLKVYDKTLGQPENCCNSCLQLNHILPKKINNTYLSLNQPTTYKLDEEHHNTRGKSKEDNEGRTLEIEMFPLTSIKFVNVKEEPLF